VCCSTFSFRLGQRLGFGGNKAGSPFESAGRIDEEREGKAIYNAVSRAMGGVRRELKAVGNVAGGHNEEDAEAASDPATARRTPGGEIAKK